MTEATTEQDRATFTQRARKALAEHPIPRDHIRALLHQATAIIEAIDATAAAEDEHLGAPAVVTCPKARRCAPGARWKPGMKRWNSAPTNQPKPPLSPRRHVRRG